MRDTASTKRVTTLKPRAGKKPNLTPGIVKTKGVCGGKACFIRTRIPVWIIEAYRNHGATNKELLRNFPTLHAADLAQSRIYYEHNPREIDSAIRQNEELR